MPQTTPQVIMAGHNINQLGWDGVCRLQTQAIRDRRTYLAMAYATINHINAFTPRSRLAACGGVFSVNLNEPTQPHALTGWS